MEERSFGICTYGVLFNGLFFTFPCATVRSLLLHSIPPQTEDIAINYTLILINLVQL